MYDGFFTSLAAPYLDQVGEAIHIAGFAMPMLCRSPDFTSPDPDGRKRAVEREAEMNLGKGPQNLAITPDGKLLLCANMPGNNVAVFHIDAESGSLNSAGKSVSVTSPTCIRLQP
jgi:hypothetical protein